MSEKNYKCEHAMYENMREENARNENARREKTFSDVLWVLQRVFVYSKRILTSIYTDCD